MQPGYDEIGDSVVADAAMQARGGRGDIFARLVGKMPPEQIKYFAGLLSNGKVTPSGLQEMLQYYLRGGGRQRMGPRGPVREPDAGTFEQWDSVMEGGGR